MTAGVVTVVFTDLERRGIQWALLVPLSMGISVAVALAVMRRHAQETVASIRYLSVRLSTEATSTRRGSHHGDGRLLPCDRPRKLTPRNRSHCHRQVAFRLTKTNSRRGTGREPS